MSIAALIAALIVAGCGSGPATPSPAVVATATVGFAPTGPLSSARAQQTASLLSTGRVLIAGGGAPAEAARAELYDPTTGTFAATGSMMTARYGATATVLADGKVLIAGGWSEDPNTPVLASAELYDPATGRFSSTGPMTTPRAGHSAALLSDGRVLITGGEIEVGDLATPLASAELYDPARGTFSATGSMTVARFNHTSTTLAGGKVLIAGGGGPAGTTASGLSADPGIPSAELYDPASGTFASTGSMSVGRYWQTATPLADGRVLIAGGNDGNGPLVSAELYDPASGRFAPTGSMAAARYLQTATRLNDGTVLVAGGYAEGVGSLSSAELYDPGRSMFTSAGSMADSRFEHTATLLADGRVLIAAGGSTDKSIDDAARLATAELYKP